MATPWIPSSLETTSSCALGAGAASRVEWRERERVRVSVHLGAPQQTATEYVWQVPPVEAEKAYSTLLELRSKRPSADRIALSIEPGAELTRSELAARDALERISHLHYSEALTAADRAQALVDQSDPSGAIPILRCAVEVLGDLYTSPGMIDDTQMKWIDAGVAISEGNLDQAVGLLQGVLQTRLRAYEDLRQPEPPEPQTP